MEKVGTMGRYQIYLFAILILISLFSGSITFMTPFLFYQTHYQCDPSFSPKQCLNYVCSLPLEERAEFIPADPFITSFANRFGDYRCPNQQSELDLIKSLYYFGKLMGYLLVAFLGDFFRSKTIVVGGITTTLIGIIVATTTGVFWLSLAGLFVMPMGLIMSYNLTYIYITEMVEQKSRQKYKIIIASVYNVGGLLNVFMYFVSHNFEIVLLGFFGGSLIVITTLFIVFFKDTPNSLVTKNTP